MEVLLLIFILFLILIIAIQRTRAKSVLVASERQSNYIEFLQKQISVHHFASELSEVARELMLRSPEKYTEVICELLKDFEEINKLDQAQRIALCEELADQPSSYENFGSGISFLHEFEAERWIILSDEELRKRYRDARMLSALKCDHDKDWHYFISVERKRISCPSNWELERLTSYREQISDTRLHLSLRCALEQFLQLDGSCDKETNGDWTYQTKEYSYRDLGGSSRRKIGVYLKSSSKFGVIEFSKEGSEVSDQCFYAATSDFDEIELEPLRIGLFFERATLN